MNILSPISRSEDTKPLLSLGVKEFFGGIALDWNKNYHIINSINRRYFEDANFKDLKELEHTLKLINDYNASFFITMNAPYYVPEQYDYLQKYIHIMEDIGVTGTIASDMDLIKFIKDKHPKLKIHVSTVSACINIESIDFFADLNVDRIVLPRELTLEEILEIRANTNIELEVFSSPFGCSGIDGYCGYQHIHEEGNSPCIHTSPELFSNQIYTEETSVNISLQDCKLCQIFDFYKSGIDSIKIIGRGDPLPLIQKKIILLKKIFNFLKKKEDLKKGSFHEFVIKEIAPKSSFKCNIERCIYKN